MLDGAEQRPGGAGACPACGPPGCRPATGGGPVRPGRRRWPRSWTRTAARPGCGGRSRSRRTCSMRPRRGCSRRGWCGCWRRWRPIRGCGCARWRCWMRRSGGRCWRGGMTPRRRCRRRVGCRSCSRRGRRRARMRWRWCAVGWCWTYGELERRAGRLARVLAVRGRGRSRWWGCAWSAAPELVAAMLAVWQAGAAYLPLDPGYPAERLAFMLADSGAAVLVVQPRRCGGLAGCWRRVPGGGGWMTRRWRRRWRRCRRCGGPGGAWRPGSWRM